MRAEIDTLRKEKAVLESKISVADSIGAKVLRGFLSQIERDIERITSEKGGST